MKIYDKYMCEIKEVTNETIVNVYTNKHSHRICIHKITGYGQGWYLSVPSLLIDNLDLKTTYFDEAVFNAKSKVKKRLEELQEQYKGFIE